MIAITFIIITNGKKFDITVQVISRIIETMGPNRLYEILVVGDTSKYSELKNIVCVDAKDFANSGNLSAMRNLGAELAKYDTLVMLDDDILLGKNWYDNLVTFSDNNPWQVYACKIISPDGSRCWDKAVVFSQYQSLVSYSHNKFDKNLYQTGGYVVIKKAVFLNIKFNEKITYYSNGLVNEDVDFSRRLYQSGYHIEFDQNNTVYHKDPSLIQLKHVVVKKEHPDQLSELPDTPSNYELVYEAYRNILGREPDSEGLYEYLINAPCPHNIVKVLLESSEYKNKQGKDVI